MDTTKDEKVIDMLLNKAQDHIEAARALIAIAEDVKQEIEIAKFHEKLTWNQIPDDMLLTLYDIAVAE